MPHKAFFFLLSHKPLLRAVLLCLFSAIAQPSIAATVLVVLSDTSPAFREFAQAFQQSLAADSTQADVLVLEAPQIGAASLPEAQLIVAVGSRAAEILASRDLRTPLMLSMLPRASVDRLLPRAPKAGGVYIDQPASRTIALITAALPEATHVGMLVGQDSREAANRLTAAAREARLRSKTEPVLAEADIYPAMQRLFADQGVLLALPDSRVFNAQTLPSILLTAFRLNVPMVGFSPSYVNAGAVVALYSTPTQIARQSAEISRKILAGGAMPPPQYPRDFTVGTNVRVARSLGIPIEEETVIKDRLERLERKP